MDVQVAPNVSTSSADATGKHRPHRRANLYAVIACLAVAGFFGWHMVASSASSHYARGLSLASAGRMAEAEREWQDCIAAEPANADCYAKLGDLYMAGGNSRAAVLKYGAATKRRPDDGTLHLRYARSLQAQAELPAAGVEAKRAAELLPRSADAQVLWASLAQQQGDLPAALAAWRAARALDPGSPDTVHALVRLELDMLDTEAAERDLTQWLRSHPDDAPACSLMSVVYSRKPVSPDTTRQGIAYAERGIEGGSREPDAPVVLGRLYLDAGRPRDALAVLHAARKQHPNDEGILHGIVDAYSSLGQRAEVEATARVLSNAAARHQRIAQLKRRLNSDPGNLGAGIELAGLLEQDGDIHAAETEFLRNLRRRPHDPSAHGALAAFYRRTGQPQKAELAEELDFNE